MDNVIRITPWKRYALISEIIRQFSLTNLTLGKSALQKLVFLLQEVYNLDIGYDFELFAHGPHSTQLTNDIGVLESWKCITITYAGNTPGMFRIRPTEAIDAARSRSEEFLNDAMTKQVLEGLISIYGPMPAEDLDLRATAVYVARNLQKNREIAALEKVCLLVSQIKPKVAPEEIANAVVELSEQYHIHAAV